MDTRERNRGDVTGVVAPSPSPSPGPAAGGPRGDAQARVRRLAEAGDDLIEAALSEDSQTYLQQNEQEGGQ